MLHITGQEHILLFKVNRMMLSHITPLRKTIDEQGYQRQLIFVTDDGILTMTLIATDRATLAFAGE
jgi:hypothetical protein